MSQTLPLRVCVASENLLLFFFPDFSLCSSVVSPSRDTHCLFGWGRQGGFEEGRFQFLKWHSESGAYNRRDMGAVKLSHSQSRSHSPVPVQVAPMLEMLERRLVTGEQHPDQTRPDRCMAPLYRRPDVQDSGLNRPGDQGRGGPRWFGLEWKTSAAWKSWTNRHHCLHFTNEQTCSKRWNSLWKTNTLSIRSTILLSFPFQN